MDAKPAQRGSSGTPGTGGGGGGDNGTARVPAGTGERTQFSQVVDQTKKNFSYTTLIMWDAAMQNSSVYLNCVLKD